MKINETLLEETKLFMTGVLISPDLIDLEKFKEFMEENSKEGDEVVQYRSIVIGLINMCQEFNLKLLLEIEEGSELYHEYRFKLETTQVFRDLAKQHFDLI